MKKNLLIIFMCISMVFMAVSCDEPHVHSFGEWKASSEEGKVERVCKECGYVEKEEGVLVSTIDDLTKAISGESSEESKKAMLICLAKDIDLSETMKGGESAGITIERSLTLDGNRHTLYNDKELTYSESNKSPNPLVHISGNKSEVNITLQNINIINKGEVKCNGFRLMNIFDVCGGKVTLENVQIKSEAQWIDGYNNFRGISISDNKGSTIELSKVELSIPTYYAINLFSDTDKVGLTLNINDSIIKGWAAINNFDEELIVNATDSQFLSVNKYDGNDNDFACIVVSQNETLGKNRGSANMTFTDCVFTSSIAEEGSKVKQNIFDIRNTDGKVSTLTLKGCILNPATNSETFKCAKTGHTITVNGKKVDPKITTKTSSDSTGD